MAGGRRQTRRGDAGRQRSLGFQAPLFFLNAYEFSRQLPAPLTEPAPPKLIVLEAAGILDVDFTGAQVFKHVVDRCRQAGAQLAVARLEAVRAQKAFARLGLTACVGEDHIFDSVAAAVDTLVGVKEGSQA